MSLDKTDAATAALLALTSRMLLLVQEGLKLLTDLNTDEQQFVNDMIDNCGAFANDLDRLATLREHLQ